MNQYHLAIVRQKFRYDGGAERFISYALTSLIKYNIELHIITRAWRQNQQQKWHIHICNPIKFGSRINREKRFAKSAKSIWQTKQFDIIQSHERIAGCHIYRAGDGVHRRWLIQRIRIMPSWRAKMLIHDCYHKYVMNAEYNMYHSPELKAIICNAEMIKNEIIEEFAINANKIHVIYNAVDSNYFVPATFTQRELLRQKFNLPVDATVLCFIGSGFTRKGLSIAIQVIANTPIYLIVVGYDKNIRRYYAFAKSLGCLEQIRFLGIQEDTLPFYQISDGLLLPTLYDPFPNVILEAMSCGLPVVTSNHCGGMELIEQGYNGFFCDALNVKRLKEAVMAIPLRYNDDKMSIAARNKVYKLTYDKLANQLVTVYHNILKN